MFSKIMDGIGVAAQNAGSLFCQGGAGTANVSKKVIVLAGTISTVAMIADAFLYFKGEPTPFGKMNACGNDKQLSLFANEYGMLNKFPPCGSITPQMVEGSYAFEAFAIPLTLFTTAASYLALSSLERGFNNIYGKYFEPINL